MRDRLELVWLRLTLLPRALWVSIALVVVLAGVGGGGILVVGQLQGGTENEIQVTTSVPIEANENVIAGLVTTVRKEKDAPSSVIAAVNLVRSNDSLLFSCDEALREVGKAMYVKFGLDAVTGDTTLCAQQYVIGVALAALEAETKTASTAAKVADRCGETKDEAGCVGGVVAALGQVSDPSVGLKFCDTRSKAGQQECATNAVRSLLSNRQEPFPVKICTDLPAGKVKDGCAAGVGGKYSEVDKNLAECSKFAGSAKISCVYGFASILALQPEGLQFTPAMYNECGATANCVNDFVQVLRGHSRDAADIQAECARFEGLDVQKVCTEAGKKSGK